MRIKNLLTDLLIFVFAWPVIIWDKFFQIPFCEDSREDIGLICCIFMSLFYLGIVGVSITSMLKT